MVVPLDSGEGKIHFLLTITGTAAAAWSHETEGEADNRVSLGNHPLYLDWAEVRKKYVSQL